MPKWWFSIFLLPILGGCSFPSTITSKLTPAALQIQTNPKAEVVIDNTSYGMTPLQNAKVAPGKHTITLKSDWGTYTNEITILSSTVTVLNRQFYANQTESSGEIALVEKGSGASLITTPKGATVIIDKMQVGTTPLTIPTVIEGKHDLVLKAAGYQEKSLTINVTPGYGLIVMADLARNTNSLQAVLPSPSATNSAAQSTSAPSATPTTVGTQATVLPTGTGWLRVRAQASLASAELFKINTGDTVIVLEKGNGFFRIRTNGGQEGWASAQFLQIR